MSRRLGLAWLLLECFAISILAWSELSLRSWSSATHEDISASPDAMFQIRFFFWSGAVALGAVVGLGLGAAMLATAIPKLGVAVQRTGVMPLWLLAGMALVAVIAALSLRHIPWLV